MTPSATITGYYLEPFFSATHEILFFYVIRVTGGFIKKNDAIWYMTPGRLVLTQKTYAVQQKFSVCYGEGFI
jgi:hypothetical protein